MRILVVGCERSGTSVISNLLSLSTGLSILDDPAIAWYYYPIVYKRIGRFPIKLILKIYYHSIVKVPGFATILPYLSKIHILPFKIIYVIRDPRDVVASILERLKVDYNGLFINIDWLSIRPKGLVESLSLRWKKYLSEAEKYSLTHENIIFVKYEDFINNKSSFIIGLCEQLGLECNTKILTQNSNLQFRKKWSNEIKGDMRYKKDLSDSQIKIVTDICKDLMEKHYKYE